jgi:hypothetical protein
MSPLNRRTRRSSTAFTSKRVGASLIELTAVIATNAVFVAVAVTLLIAHIRADREITERNDRRLQLAPLLDRLRSDLRAAESAEFADQGLTLATFAGGEIRYERRDGIWQRLQRPGGARNAGDAPLEFAGAFKLPKGTKLAMTPAGAAEGDLVRLEWRLPPQVRLPNREPPPAAELVVRIGSDRRLLQ